MSFPLRSLCLRTRLKSKAHLAPTTIQSVRLFSENQPRKGSAGKNYSTSHVLSGLLIFGLGLSAYGLYRRLHDAVTMWPPELRQNLRQGLYAKGQGDLATALSHLHRAWEDTKAMPLDKLGPDPLLKLSGIAITLAGVLEDAGHKELAYRFYAQGLRCMLERAFEDVTPDSPGIGLSQGDKIRAVSIAYKLGGLANTLQKPSAEEENWLTFSVQALLLTMSEGAAHRNVERKTFEGLDLPPWAMLNDFAAPFEALGSFYARTGKPDHALVLYSRAIALLLSDSPRSPTVEDKCKGAQLMGNLAELSIRSHPSENIPPEVLAGAEVRLNDALKLTRAARNPVSFSRHDLCEEVYAVLLYNFAMIRQFAGDVDAARDYFRQSLHQAKTIHLQEGISNAQAALSKLDSSE